MILLFKIIGFLCIIKFPKKELIKCFWYLVYLENIHVGTGSVFNFSLEFKTSFNNIT